MRLLIIVRRAFGSVTSPQKFPPLEIRGLTDVNKKVARSGIVPERKPPFCSRYPEKISWTDLWPAASSFNYSVVPFSIRQGYCKNLFENSGVSPGKYANAELMKIPNFLHLTKAHIKRHCDAIKKFCTDWPKGLNSEESITTHYPVEIIHSNYVFSAPSIRDPRARIVKIRVPLSRFALDDRAKRKLLRLVLGPGPGNKIAEYDYSTDILQLTSGRCPTSKQNTDYLIYVLTVLILESNKVEKWEENNHDYDWLTFDWFRSCSRDRLLSLMSNHTKKQESNSPTRSDGSAPLKFDEFPQIQQYRKALDSIWLKNDILQTNPWIQRPDPPKYRHCQYPPVKNVPFEPVPGADDETNLKSYGKATRSLFGLSTPPESNTTTTTTQSSQ
ncbi:unnamed protein product [Calicophoron daubneyi]|uniref:Small ribosomal subunit protein mS35 mitochondrial conserved domain-containing protein n=1 Tax=Calicophoron daubneyi TaxID=300641 RepID=A0AAV2TYR7_CALDB